MCSSRCWTIRRYLSIGELSGCRGPGRTRRLPVPGSLHPAPGFVPAPGPRPPAPGTRPGPRPSPTAFAYSPLIHSGL
ncbi:MAG: hypothetical protein FJ149_05130 [Euryarchaeota archaeon]|nr:hypothetical protein [Euryarchaeota archaeon]